MAPPIKQKSESFSPSDAVVQYRQLITQRNAATGDEKSALDGQAKALRQAWTTWQGEDSLHETTFGKPEA